MNRKKIIYVRTESFKRNIINYPKQVNIKDVNWK